MTDVERWERQPDERDEAWIAFQTYRDMPLPRSIRKTADQLNYDAHSTCGRFSSRHNWQERAVAWDLEQDRQRRAGLRRENIRAGERHATIAAGGLQVAARVNVEFLSRLGVENSRLKTMPFAELADLVVKVNRYVPRLVVAERLARGMSTESVEVQGDIDVHRQTVEGWGEERLDAFLAGAASADRVRDRENAQLGAGEHALVEVESDDADEV